LENNHENTSNKTYHCCCSALTLGALGIAGTRAETPDVTQALIYNNRAYVQDIGYAPNPVFARKVEATEIVYLNNAFGPAIYSYPSNSSNQATAFNIEFVDTAYGPALYSYPNNNPKHRLELVDNSEGADNNVVPAALLIRSGAAWAAKTTVKP
jgi:hypothetical protein